MSVDIRNLCCRFLPKCSRASRRRQLATPVALEALEMRVLPAASVLVSPASNSNTTEAGGTAEFAVVLSAVPAGKLGAVEIPIRSSNPSEGTVSVSHLTFNKSNWYLPQRVTVTGADDHQVDGDRSYKIELGKVATKSRNYRRVDPADVRLINKDNDGPPPGILMSPTTLVLKDAVSKTVTLRLATKPSADVDVVLHITAGSDQAQLSADRFTFTPTNWNVAQTLTIGAFQDDVHDGDQPFTFTLDAVSSDTEYNQLPIQSSTITILDADPLLTTPDGTFRGTLSGTRTDGNVTTPTSGEVEIMISGTTVTVALPGAGTGTVSGSLITFSETGGATYTGRFVEQADGTISASGTWQILQNGVSGGTGVWSVTDVAHITAGLQISPTQNIVLDEKAQQNVTFSLTSRPESEVQVNLAPTVGIGHATLSKSSLTFTPDNWFTPQTVTLTGKAVSGADGDQVFQFTATPVSSDPAYGVLTPRTVSATVHHAGALDGVYTGTYSGSVSVIGAVHGDVVFSVSGDVVTVTKPAAATGTIQNKQISFSSAYNSLPVEFIGSFVENDDGTVTASGNWTIASSGINGSGTWEAIRPAAV